MEISSFRIRALACSIFFFVFIIMPGKLSAQRSGEYKVSATYDSEGKRIQTDYAFPRIFVVYSDFMGIKAASLTTYNPMMNMYNTDAMDFQYCGYNNGWYIFRCDVFMMGTDFLYLHEDGNHVRLKYSFMKGKYNEYIPFKRGEDVDRGPTY